MSGSNKSPKSDHHSIKYRRNRHGGACFEVDLSCVNYTPSLSNNENKQCYTSSDPKPPERLSTAQLISAVGHILDSASRPLSFLLRKENVNQDDVKRNEGVWSSNNTNYFHINTGTICYGSQVVQEKLDFPKVTEKVLVPESCSGSQDYIHSLFQRSMQATDNNSNEYQKEMELGSEKNSFRSRNVYWWMIRNAPKELKYHVKATDPKNMKNSSLASGVCISIDRSTPALANEGGVCNLDLTVHEGPPLSNDAIMDPGNSSTCNSASVQRQHKVDDNEFLEIQRRHFSDITDNEPNIQNSAETPQKPCHSVAKQEHAFSGALSGVCVSLCLHPVDTVKTVIQSCSAEQRSIFNISKSIVSERGLLGLYRGISTNIACSAPISAVYTFTYESVKAALLPCLQKEYYSFAHCVGGGCASIATSFIFTPSERIKQQMQVGSHYRSCWDALVGIIRNGGFPSLYAGWGAVLCRNIPHSIIKFYTYESLKQAMPSSPSSVQPNTSQTIVCGGLAGSTAALFTTPFDVIKTRLQTQIPGSMNQYDNVFHALYKISKGEGLKGLYRGLTPRLIMYMSQGSLFFASYEFFKRVLSLEASHPTGSHV